MFNCVNTLQKRLVNPAFFYVVAISCFLFACSEPAPEQWQLQGPTMGTSYHVKVVKTQQVDIGQAQLQEALDAKLLKINQSMSTYIQDSELSRFNRAAVGEWITVSHELCLVLSDAATVFRASEGGFDPTVGPLVNLWGFGPDSRSAIPSDEELHGALSVVGYDALEMHCAELKIRKHKALYIDLSAIAKGWAVDHLAEYLQGLGFSDFMVEIGGELRLSGLNAERQKWRIAIEKPMLGQGSAAQVLALSNVAVATSGDYRNYIEQDGQRYSHTIDPQTGRPIVHKLASVTVISDTSAMADAWATALNVLGPERGMAIAEKEGLAVYFIVREGQQYVVKYTHLFESYMVNL